MRIIKTRFLPPGAFAFTVYPIGVFSRTGRLSGSMLIHEAVHWKHQRQWCLYGLGVGLLLWFLLYLVVLPVGWNPLRAWTERAAFRMQGCPDSVISDILKQPPYYLWWKQ